MSHFLIITFVFFVQVSVSFGQTTGSPNNETDISCSVRQDYTEVATVSAIRDRSVVSSETIILYSGIVMSDSSLQTNQEITSMAMEPSGFLDKNRTMLTIGGSLAVTAALLATDQATYNTLYLWKMNHHFVNQASPIITNLGDGKTSLVLFGGAFAYSFAFGDKGAKEIGTIGLESFALSGIAAYVLKLTFSREQPNVATRSGGTFYGPFAFFRQDQNSGKGWSFFDAFPSGHTASAFAAATTIADFCSTPWVSAASYSIASMVGVSRIMEQTHWASDVFVGGLIGYYSTKLVEKLNDSPQDFFVEPAMGVNHFGMMFSVRM